MRGLAMKKAMFFVGAIFLVLSPTAQGQGYPARAITLVAPFPPGGPSDTTARLITGPMSKVLGQQIVVENVTGAGGVIGTNRVAKAAPDGYTLIVSGSGTHAAAEHLRKDLPYRSSDFEQIGLINTSPMVLVARSGFPPDTLKDLVNYIKANENKVTEADAGVGSISNLACSVFHSLAHVHPTVASYRGTPEVTMDLLRGNVDFGCNQIVNVLAHVRSGKLKAYALTSEKRLADAARGSHDCRSGHAGVQSDGLVWPLRAEGHAACDHGQAQPGARRRTGRFPSGRAVRRPRLCSRTAGKTQLRLFQQILQR
jgi:tripartite-type tricarboxylate transporter receptor subunit TctC